MSEEMHPWYGPCDGFGPGFTCSQCTGRIIRNDGFVVELATGRIVGGPPFPTRLRRAIQAFRDELWKR